MSIAVEFDNIVKEFGAVWVLHGVSFTLQPGRTVGLLVKNGAGKSTLMQIFSGFGSATSGNLRINGKALQFASSREAEAHGIVLVSALITPG